MTFLGMPLMFRSCLKIRLLPNCSSIAVTSKTEYKNITLLVDDLFCKRVMFIHSMKYGIGHSKSERGLPYQESLPSYVGSARPQWAGYPQERSKHTRSTQMGMGLAVLQGHWVGRGTGVGFAVVPSRV